MRQRKKPVNLVRNTLAYYFLLLSFIVLALLLVNLLSLSNTTHQTLNEANQEITLRVNQLLDSSLSEIDRLSMQMTTVGNVRRVIYDTQEPSYPRVKAITELLSSFTQTKAVHPLISHISLYSGVHDKVLTAGQYTKLSAFADTSWHTYYTDPTAKSGWLRARQTFWSDSDVVAVGNNKTKETLVTLMRLYPLGATNGAQKGALLFHVRAYDLLALLTRNGRTEDNLILVDSDGTPVFENSNFPLDEHALSELDFSAITTGSIPYGRFSLNGIDYRVYAAASDYTGWTCLNFVDQRIFARSLQSFAVFLSVLTLGVLLIGGIGILIIGKWSFKPVQQFTGQLAALLNTPTTENMASHLTFQEIALRFSDIVTEREHMTQQLAESLPQVRWRLVRDILTSGCESYQEMEPSLQFVGIKLLPANYLVITMQDQENTSITNLTMHRASMQAIAELMESCLKLHCEGCTIHLGDGLTASLCSFQTKEESRGLSLQIAALIQQEMHKEFPGRIHIGIGEMVRTIGDVPQSYRQAIEALQYSVHIDSAEPAIFYGDIPKAAANAEYALYQRIEPLCADLRLGNYDKLHCRFEKLAEKIKGAYLPIEKERRILDMLCVQAGSAVLSRGVPLSDALQMQSLQVRAQVDRAEDTQALFESVRTYLSFLQIASETHQEKNSESVAAKQARQTLLLISQQYGDPDLSLTTVAEQMKLSPSYLSRILKQESGVTFLDSLTRIRIARARELLEQTGAKVSDVAPKVGYTSIHTFIRAFKKLTGQTPGQWGEDKE